MAKKFDGKENNGSFRDLVQSLKLVSMIGITMVVCIFSGFFLGFYLDRWLGTKGLLLALFILLGIVSGFYQVYRIIMREK